jgi:hypothetical protein
MWRAIGERRDVAPPAVADVETVDRPELLPLEVECANARRGTAGAVLSNALRRTNATPLPSGRKLALLRPPPPTVLSLAEQSSLCCLLRPVVRWARLRNRLRTSVARRLVAPPTLLCTLPATLGLLLSAAKLRRHASDSRLDSLVSALDEKCWTRLVARGSSRSASLWASRCATRPGVRLRTRVCWRTTAPQPFKYARVALQRTRSRRAATARSAAAAGRNKVAARVRERVRGQGEHATEDASEKTKPAQEGDSDPVR